MNPFINIPQSKPVPIEENVTDLCNILAEAEVIKFRASLRVAGLLDKWVNA